MAHKLINGPQSQAKEGARNLPANQQQGCPTIVPKVTLSKEETGRKREEEQEDRGEKRRIENRSVECSDFEG